MKPTPKSEVHTVTEGGIARHLRFSTERAALLADDAYNDGGEDHATGAQRRGSWERDHRNSFLYRCTRSPLAEAVVGLARLEASMRLQDPAPRHRYFAQRRTRHPGEEDGRLEPLMLDQAIRLYEQLRVKHVPFELAFPGVVIEEA